MEYNLENIIYGTDYFYIPAYTWVAKSERIQEQLKDLVKGDTVKYKNHLGEEETYEIVKTRGKGSFDWMSDEDYRKYLKGLK